MSYAKKILQASELCDSTACQVCDYWRRWDEDRKTGFLPKSILADTRGVCRSRLKTCVLCATSVASLSQHEKSDLHIYNRDQEFIRKSGWQQQVIHSGYKPPVSRKLASIWSKRSGAAFQDYVPPWLAIIEATAYYLTFRDCNTSAEFQFVAAVVQPIADLFAVDLDARRTLVSYLIMRYAPESGKLTDVRAKWIPWAIDRHHSRAPEYWHNHELWNTILSVYYAAKGAEEGE
jgi:hypothetical protein